MNLEEIIEKGLELKCNSSDVISEIINPELVKTLIIE